jgi:acyl carrier protein
MVPATFVMLDALPLTPSGKVDRKALPMPGDSSFRCEYIAPTTETENTLVHIWADLLKLDPNTISVDANLFELGGHSLLLVKLTTEIRKQFSIELSIGDVMEHPQLNLLAEQIFRVSLKKTLTASSEYKVGAEETEITV